MAKKRKKNPLDSLDIGLGSHFDLCKGGEPGVYSRVAAQSAHKRFTCREKRKEKEMEGG